MKVLILGGSGMLGHQLLVDLKKKHEVRVTLREPPHHYAPHELFNQNNSYFNLNLTKIDALRNVLSDFQPNAIVNAAGVIKQRQSENELAEHLEMNALFPHQLAALSKENNIRLIHISTDCVFSGIKGQYSEADSPDATDIYGKTKLLGEVQANNIISLRTSFIGLELFRKTSLLEWYLAQKGQIKGYKRAFFSGLTTLEMSKVIDLLLTTHTHLSGIWNVAGQSISKYDLLLTLTTLLQRKDVSIAEDNTLICDRSLTSHAFHQATRYLAPSWEQMLFELKQQIQRNPNYSSQLCAY